MKKFYKIIIICFFIVMATIFLISCGSKEVLELSKSNLSEIRNNLFVGKSENVIVTYTSGYREEVYKIDGKSTGNIDFGVITVIVLNNKKFESTKNFVANINGKDYSGEFEINPYDNSLVFDTQVLVEDWSTISVSVILDELYETIKLENISLTWNIDNMEALEIACSSLKNDLKKYIKENVFNMEVYIKILFNFDNLDNPYFWYVSFVGTDNKDISVVLDVMSGKILSKKIM